MAKIPIIEMAKKIKNANPDMHPGALAAGIAVGAGVLGLANYANIKLHQQGINDAKGRGTIANHPYLSSIGGNVGTHILASNPVTVPLAIPATLGNFYLQGRSGAEANRHLEKGDPGLFASYTKKHPYLGSALSALTLTDANYGIAGETLSKESIKNKDFTYNHPYASTFLHGMIPFPGMGPAYTNAAARILNYKEKRRPQ